MSTEMLKDYQCIDFKKLLLLKGKSIGLKDEETHILLLMIWYFADEFHLLLKEEQTAAYSAERCKTYISSKDFGILFSIY